MGLVTINLFEMKTCRSGLHKLPITNSRCPQCTQISNMAWRARNKEKTAAYNKEYNAKVSVREYRRVWIKNYRSGSESARALHAFRESQRMRDERYRFVRTVHKYGLEVQDFANMLRAQGFKCLGCSEPLDLSDTSIDHCHSSGRVRGLLCDACNTTLGHAKDSPSTLRALAVYLESSIAA